MIIIIIIKKPQRSSDLKTDRMFSPLFAVSKKKKKKNCRGPAENSCLFPPQEEKAGVLWPHLAKDVATNLGEVTSQRAGFQNCTY